MKKIKWVMLVVTLAVIFPLNLYAQSSSWDELYKAAKAEGKIIWQVGTPENEYKLIIGAFEKRFPGIKIETTRSYGPAMISRFITESAAKNVTIDLAMTFFPAVKPLYDRGILARFDIEGLESADPDSLIMDGHFLNWFGFSGIVIYNTNLVSPDNVPKTWEDLLRPEWKGQICMAQTQPGPSVLFNIWEEGKVIDYLKALSKQNMVVESGANMTLPRCANGEVAIADTGSAQLKQWMDKGTPIAVAPISPQWNTIGGLYGVVGAPHPNATKLFVAWLTTKEAIKINAQEGRGPSYPCDASPQAKIYCDNGIKLIPVARIEQIAEHSQMIEKTRAILGFKPPSK